MMFKSAKQYGDTLNSYDVLKLLALGAMVIDHVGNFIFPGCEWLRATGRFAFPAFLFLVGYSGAWKVKPDIVIGALMIVVCAAFTHHAILPLNILFGIIGTRYAMRAIEKQGELIPQELARLFLICFILWVGLMMLVDYSTFSLLFALCGWLQRRHPKEQITLRFTGVVMALHIVLQWMAFKFSLASGLLSSVILMGTFFYLTSFSLREVATPRMPASLRYILQFISRNALLFYVLHVAVLMVLEYYLFPVRLKHFKWF